MPNFPALSPNDGLKAKFLLRGVLGKLLETLRHFSREVLIKSLEILRDFKGADSRRALQAMAIPCQKAQQRSCPLKARPKGAKPNSRPLRYPFLPYRHTPAKRCLDAGNLACPEAKRFNQHFPSQDWKFWKLFRLFCLSLFILFPTLSTAAREPAENLPTNVLLNNPSPYLAMHGHDPVDWHSWSQQTLEQAKKQNKLILISSGYFACHWCHVMQRENYQDPEAAQTINQHFIAVKVDRELSPDLDAYLIRFAERATGRAGWPQHVILTPEGYPVVAFTYLPHTAFLKTLKKVANFWQQHPQQMIQLAKAFIPPANPLLPTPLTLTPQAFQTALFKQLELAKDEISGGLGNSKFPSEPLLSVLLQTPNLPESLEEWLQLTLEQMRMQHLQDQVNGGFFRYTIDPNWQTPHFEKMLYNQAQLIEVYLLAYQRWQQPEDLQTALSTYHYALKHLWNPTTQLFQSSESAIDDQHIEGGNYLFSKAQLKAKLPLNLYKVVAKAWKLNQPAPFEAGWLPSPQGIPKELWPQIQQALQTPATQIPHDSKSILGWNALMLQALYRLSITLPPHQAKSVLAETLGLQNRLIQLMLASNPPRALSKTGQPMGQATLEEYTFLIKALKTGQQLAKPEQKRSFTPWITNLEKVAQERYLTPYGWRLSLEPLLPGQTGHWEIPDDALPSATAPLQCHAPDQVAQVQNEILQMPVQYPSVLPLLHCIALQPTTETSANLPPNAPQ